MVESGKGGGDRAVGTADWFNSRGGGDEERFSTYSFCWGVSFGGWYFSSTSMVMAMDGRREVAARVRSQCRRVERKRVSGIYWASIRS